MLTIFGKGYCRNSLQQISIQPYMMVCNGWTEPHYDTFDGAGINYQGVGLFVMSARSSQDRCAHLRDFQVLVDHEHRNGITYQSWIRSVTLVLPGIVVLYIGPNRQITVISGAIPWTMTFTTLSYAVPIRPGIVTVLRVETDFGLIVEFDGRMWASVKISSNYRKCVEGLCGNADGDPMNDYRTRLGVNVRRLPSNRRFWSIGNSWRVNDIRESPRARGFERAVTAARFEAAPLTGSEQTVDKVDLSCNRKIMRTVDSNAYCGFLKNAAGPFAACIKKMPRVAKSMYEGCKYDVCANKNNLRFARTVAQSSVATFVAICGGNGLLTEEKVVSKSRGPGVLQSRQ
ncbi:Alpha-tectorin [Lamellibrachia satsuma]|nr:Alpha-tectorin [Lamellibrachia satsuma]